MLAYNIGIAINEMGAAMKLEEFQAMSAQLENLTPHQRSLLKDRLHKIDHIHAVNSMVESRISRWGFVSGLQRYRCKGCHATFNALTGTPLARLRHKEKWLEYAQQMSEVKACATARRPVVCTTTPRSVGVIASWRCPMPTRLRACPVLQRRMKPSSFNRLRARNAACRVRRASAAARLRSAVSLTNRFLC